MPRGLLVPGGKLVIRSVRKRPDDRRFTIAEGFVARLPTHLAGDFTDRAGVEILFQEDEGHEAEILVSDGSHRSFSRLIRICDAGSRFTALLFAEDAVRAPVPAP